MRTKYWASAWYAIEFYLRKKSFIGEEEEEANRTIDFVGKEYYSKIDAIDARVLKLIHRGKTAMGQLRRHSGPYPVADQLPPKKTASAGTCPAWQDGAQ